MSNSLQPMECSLQGSSVHGILQARILEWVAIPFSTGSSHPRGWTWVSCTAGRFFIIWATREAHIYVYCVHVCRYHKCMYICILNAYSNPLNKSLYISLSLYILDIYLVYREIYFPSFLDVYWEEDNPKGNQSWIFIGRTDAEAEALILWPPDVKNWLIGKDPDAGRDWGQEEKGMTEDEMVGWHHWLNGHEFEQALGVGDRQGSLVCYSPGVLQRVRHDWGTELNWIELNWLKGGT